jgi:hypothetical protein
MCNRLLCILTQQSSPYKNNIDEDDQAEEQRGLIQEVYDALLNAKGEAHDGSRKGQHKYAYPSLH